MTKNLKYILIPAFAGMIFSSCTSNTSQCSPEEMDARAEVKVKEATDKMRADCDAQILEMAMMKRDSILIKMGKMKAPVAGNNSGSKLPVTTKTTVTSTTTTVTKVEPAKTVPSNTNRPGSNQGQQVPANNKTRPGSNEGMQQQQQKTETKPSNNTRPGAEQR